MWNLRFKSLVSGFEQSFEHRSSVFSGEYPSHCMISCVVEGKGVSYPPGYKKKFHLYLS